MKFCLGLITLLVAHALSAISPETPPNTYLGRYCEYAFDSLDCNDIKCFERLKWFTVDEDVPRFGQLHEKLIVRISAAEGLALSVENSLLNHCVKMIDSKGLPLERVSYAGTPMFRTDSSEDVFLEISGAEMGTLPIVNWDEDGSSLRRHRFWKSAFIGTYIGVAFLVCLSAVMMWFSVADVLYLIYFLFVCAVANSQLLIHGFWNLVANTSSGMLYENRVPISVSITVVLSSVFVMKWMPSRFGVGVFGKIIRCFLFSGAICLLAVVFIEPSFVRFWVAVNTVGLSLAIMLKICVKPRQFRTREGMFFAIGWIIFVSGSVVFSLVDFGVLPYSFTGRILMTVGSLIEMVLFMCLLAFRFGDSKSEQKKKDAHIVFLRTKLEALSQSVERDVLALKAELLNNQMSPHFIFNSLSTLQGFVLKSDVDASMKYMGRFSRLVRLSLEFSRSERIFLAQELELLSQYVGMEQDQIVNGFDFGIHVDEGLDPSDIAIPPFIIQPFVENAIKHGLSLLRSRRGRLQLIVVGCDSGVLIHVQDNGVGRERASLMARRDRLASEKEHNSLALNIIEERADLLARQGLFHVNASIEDIRDAEGSPRGTQVTVEIVPL